MGEHNSVSAPVDHQVAARSSESTQGLGSQRLNQRSLERVRESGRERERLGKRFSSGRMYGRTSGSGDRDKGVRAVEGWRESERDVPSSLAIRYL